MRLSFRSIAAAVALTLCTACAARSATPGGAPTGDRNQITQDDILRNHFNDVYAAVESLHPSWMRVRGNDSLNQPSQIWVYVDNTRRGGLDELHNIAPTLVEYVRFFDPAAANNRWGAGHSAGVIYVSLRPTSK